MIKRLMKLELILSSLLIFIPFILFLIDGELRSSISDYAYMSDNHFFVVLLTVAGAMFINNGSLWNRQFYNIILGVALIGVACTPHEDIPIPHYIFASIFFVGSLIIMVLNGSLTRILFSVLIAIGMLGHFVFGLYSLLWAEWIGMLPITVHFILKSCHKNSLNL